MLFLLVVVYFYAAVAWCFVAFVSVRFVAVGPMLLVAERRAGLVFFGGALTIAVGLTRLAHWMAGGV